MEPSNTPPPTPQQPAQDPQPTPPAQAFAAAPQQQPEVQPSSGLAIASMVLGILGMLTGFLGIGILLGLIGVILGIVSLVKHKGGKGMAIAGIATGGIAFVFGGIFFAITMVAYSGIQERARLNQETIMQQKRDAANEALRDESDLFGN